MFTHRTTPLALYPIESTKDFGPLLQNSRETKSNPHVATSLAGLGNELLTLAGRLESLYKRAQKPKVFRPNDAWRDARTYWRQVRQLHLSVKVAFSRELLRQTSSESERLGWDGQEIRKIHRVDRRLSCEEADAYYVSLLTQVVESCDDHSTPNVAHTIAAYFLLPPVARASLGPVGQNNYRLPLDTHWFPPKNVARGPLTKLSTSRSKKTTFLPGELSCLTLGFGRMLPKLLRHLGLRLLQKHRNDLPPIPSSSLLSQTPA